MDNQEKLATLGTQDTGQGKKKNKKQKTNQNTTKYVLCAHKHK